MTALSLRNNLFLLFVAQLSWAQGIPDRYRWLEDGNAPKVKAWALVQNQKAEDYLAKIPRNSALDSRLRELYYVDSVSLPQQAGTKLFYKRTLANREQPLFFWRSLSKGGAEQTWLDPAELEGKKHLTVGDWVPSPDGRYIAYSVHTEGADQAVLRLRNILTRQDESPDNIAGANFADVAWSPDSRGFYYMNLPESAAIPESERVAHGDIRYHVIGHSPSRDVVVYPPTGDASKYLTPQVSIDGQWLFVIMAHGWTDNAIYVTSREDPSFHFEPLFVSTFAVADAVAWKGYFYLHTNEWTPHGKIMRKKPEAKEWETIIPERPDITIESMHIAGGYIVLSVLKNISNEIEVYRLNGQRAWDIPIPQQGKVWGLNGRENQDNLYLDYQSFFVPPRIYRARLDERKLGVWEESKISVDPNRFQADLVWYASKDGTRVSMMIVHRKDFVRDGAAPVILEGYGGFNTPILPRFSQEVLAWLEMGGVYAVPQLRGGGEYGEAWHQGGMLTHKQNTFDDFIAAAEYLIKEKYTRPERLAIQGASNGGLLVCAVLTQRPELFRAVICKNPLTDMIRYPLFGEGQAWIPEYGSPKNADERKALVAYSPYHHVVKGTAYPSLLMFAGEHDDRVDPMHARKFVAALQAANTSGRPILFKWLEHSGHSNSDLLADQVEETSERISFLKNELGL